MHGELSCVNSPRGETRQLQHSCSTSWLLALRRSAARRSAAQYNSEAQLSPASQYVQASCAAAASAPFRTPQFSPGPRLII